MHKKIDNLHAAIPALVYAGRNKRFAAALPATAGLVTLAIESISGYLQAKRNKAMANALNAMKEFQIEHDNRLNRYNNELLLYGKFSMNSTEEMIEALQDMYSQQSFVEKIVRNLTLDWPTRYLSKPTGIALYAAHLGTYLHALTEKYNTLYRELIYNPDRLLKATNDLSKGRIPIELIPPDMLEMFAEDVMKQLRLTYPDYTLALPHISYYYDMELVTFGIDEESALIVTFPMFIKPIHLQSLTLYGIEIHVPIDDLNSKADSFSNVCINEEYLAGNQHHNTTTFS